ncbi:MAG: ATP-grasp domain-containing protein [Ruminococcus sp.]|nr:ATP-grasp domain-containing protein [Ruminococcus sp.]
MAKTKVLVLFGGTTADEYRQSLASAAHVLSAIPEDKYEIIPLGRNARGRWLYFQGSYAEIADGSWERNPDCIPTVLSPDAAHHGILITDDEGFTHKRVDVVFSLMSDCCGEDGSVQGLCELTRIPYVGNNVLGSAISHNKKIANTLLNAADIPTPKWVAVSQRSLSRLERECEIIEQKLGYPVFVKPAGVDSAFGENAAHNREELLTAMKRAFTKDATILVEQFVTGRSLCVGIFGYDLPFATFVGEKIGNTVRVPADLDEEIAEAARNMALEAFRVLEGRGLALVDFHYAENGALLLDELNTAPDLSADAPYPTLMNDLGMRYSYLLDKLIQQAMEHADRGF